jgi:hypothetical protein
MISVQTVADSVPRPPMRREIAGIAEVSRSMAR